MKLFIDSVKEMSIGIKLLLPTVKNKKYRLEPFESLNRVINNTSHKQPVHNPLFFFALIDKVAPELENMLIFINNYSFYTQASY